MMRLLATPKVDISFVNPSSSSSSSSNNSTFPLPTTDTLQVIGGHSSMTNYKYPTATSSLSMATMPSLDALTSAISTSHPVLNSSPSHLSNTNTSNNPLLTSMEHRLSGIREEASKVHSGLLLDISLERKNGSSLHQQQAAEQMTKVEAQMQADMALLDGKAEAVGRMFERVIRAGWITVFSAFMTYCVFFKRT